MRHLVVEELRVARALQWQHAKEQRDGKPTRPEAAARLGEHGLDLAFPEERLGHHQVRTGLELAGQPIPLPGRIRGGGIEGGTRQ